MSTTEAAILFCCLPNNASEAWKLLFWSAVAKWWSPGSQVVVHFSQQTKISFISFLVQKMVQTSLIIFLFPLTVWSFLSFQLPTPSSPHFSGGLIIVLGAVIVVRGPSKVGDRYMEYYLLYYIVSFNKMTVKTSECNDDFCSLKRRSCPEGAPTFMLKSYGTFFFYIHPE